MKISKIAPGASIVYHFWYFLNKTKRCEVGRQKIETSTPTIFSFLQTLMRFVLDFGASVNHHMDYLNCIDDDNANDDKDVDVVDSDDNENRAKGSYC